MNGLSHHFDARGGLIGTIYQAQRRDNMLNCLATEPT